MNKILKISLKFQYVHNWFWNHWNQNIFGHFIFIKNDLKTIQKLFSLIITIYRSVGHGYLSVAVFILIYRSYPYRYGPFHMAEQKQGDQLEPTYIM